MGYTPAATLHVSYLKTCLNAYNRPTVHLLAPERAISGVEKNGRTD